MEEIMSYEQWKEEVFAAWLRNDQDSLTELNEMEVGL